MLKLTKQERGDYMSTNNNQTSKQQSKVGMITGPTDMAKQIRTLIEETGDSSYTISQIRDIIIENNKHVAARNGVVPPSVERIYEIVTENSLDKLCEDGILIRSVGGDGNTYYKI